MYVQNTLPSSGLMPGKHLARCFLALGCLAFGVWGWLDRPVHAQNRALDPPRLRRLDRPVQSPRQHDVRRAVPSDWAENGEQAQIQLIQSSSGYDKPLHPMIEKLPDVEDELEVIHHRSQLIVARSNILRTAISDTSIIDVVNYSPNEIAVLGLARGSTTLTIWFEDNPDPVVFLIKVIRDPSWDEQRRIDFGKLEQKLKVLFPNSNVYLIPLSYKIIVRGQARDSEEAAQILQIIRGEVLTQDGGLYRGQIGDDLGNGNTFGLADALVGGGGGGGFGDAGIGNGTGWNNNWTSSIIVNMLEVPGDFQVMLHVKIAELNRSMLRRMGIDVDAILSEGSQAIGWIAGGTPANITGLFENGEISVLINALAANGTVKFLSEPTLTVMSGHTASFISGGEFAVPTIVGVGGAQGTSTTFRGFGTSLFVVPQVLDKDLIRMQITPEFSQTTEENSVNGIPGLSTRRASTTVQMREGQTVAIAGLYSHNMTTQNNRIPLIGELPFVGPLLFNAKRATNDETELLILVTPEIVRPMEADEVPPVPGHYVTLPNDPELYRWGMTEGAPDSEVYQLPPYGYGSGTGNPVGYHLFNPAPSQPGYEPAPAAQFPTAPPQHNPYGSRYSQANDVPGADGSEGWNSNDPPPTQGWHEDGTAPRMAPPRGQRYQPPMQHQPMPHPMGPQMSPGRPAPGPTYGPGSPAPQFAPPQMNSPRLNGPRPSGPPNHPSVYPLSPPPGANYQAPVENHPATSQSMPPGRRPSKLPIVAPRGVQHDRQVQPASYNDPPQLRGR